MENQLTTPEKGKTLRRRAIYAGAAVIILAIVIRLIFGGAALLEDATLADWLTYFYTGVQPEWPTEPPTKPPTEPPTEAPTEPPVIKPDPFALVLPNKIEKLYLNTSGVSFNYEKLLKKALDWDLTGDEPTVLIVHTHATEAYQNNGQFQESDPYCTLNNDYNMIAVGDRLAQLLRAQGISVIHDRTNHNVDYLKAYKSSRESVQQYLEEYPSIQLVLDLHRDAFGATDEEIRNNALTATYNGKKAAKVMFVVTTSGGNMSHPNWQENAAAVFKMRLVMESIFPGITYKTWVQTATKHNYNQHLSTGSMLLEIGAAGNTLQEAFNTMEVLAEAIVKMQGGVVVKSK
ncbi:MAG: stage II sporulation protein P [Oscillospiraceae bacterium]|nr:stage II sporulation protein P [Oscillospiraceae bacterium]